MRYREKLNEQGVNGKIISDNVKRNARSVSDYLTSSISNANHFAKSLRIFRAMMDCVVQI